MSDFWRDINPVLKKESTAKKVRNQDNAIRILNQKGIQFTRPSSHHFVVEGKIDYWPRTGKFIVRGTKDSGRGIRVLIKQLTEMEKS